jgi:hypothetical protein
MLAEEDFDAEFYLIHNSDVAEAIRTKKIQSAYWHYINFGKKERRLSRKYVDIKKFDSGFSTPQSRLGFYSLLESPVFLQLIDSDEYRMQLAEAVSNMSPTVILTKLD